MQALKACIILHSGPIHPQVLEQQIVSLGKKNKRADDDIFYFYYFVLS